MARREGGVFGARDGDWVALFDAVDFEEDFRLRRWFVWFACYVYYHLFMRK